MGLSTGLPCCYRLVPIFTNSRPVPLPPSACCHAVPATTQYLLPPSACYHPVPALCPPMRTLFTGMLLHPSLLPMLPATFFSVARAADLEQVCLHVSVCLCVCGEAGACMPLCMPVRMQEYTCVLCAWLRSGWLLNCRGKVGV